MNFFDLLNATVDEIVILDATVDTRCPFCGKHHSVAVNEQDYFDWQDGKATCSFEHATDAPAKVEWR